ncbi:hypothetical protein ElyMa_006290000 [Elysia marginata]|uniref:Neurofascin/L1/NrCAM C-terminal domain-containing protein n=1 Tax=Elysia marginata TaxID=1093978 RepID=A0AAV4HD70_9GAST|nr:hypothetical protein ElyMa_006290000 [Elysia marginata]
MSGVMNRRKTGEAGVAVRYTPCAKSDYQVDGAEEGEEEGVQDRQIAIVGEEEEEEEEGVGETYPTGNNSGKRAGVRNTFGGGGGGEDKGGGFFPLSKISAVRQRGVGGGGGGTAGRKERGKSWGSGGGESESGTGSSRGEGSGGEGSSNLSRATTSNNNEHYNAIYVDDQLDEFQDERGDLFNSGQELQHPYQYYHHHHGDCSDPDNIDYEDNEGRLGEPGSSQVSPVVTANGPRNLPPGSIFTSQQASTSTERDKLIGER